MRPLLIVSAFVLALAPVAAQVTGGRATPTEGVRTQPPGTAAASPQPAHQTQLIHGCLKPAAEADTFTVAGATRVETPASGSPAVARASQPALPDEIEVRPETRVDRSGVPLAGLKEHVGRRVELTLRPLDDAATPAPATQPAPAATPENAVAAPTTPKPVQRFVAISVRAVPGSCG